MARGHQGQNDLDARVFAKVRKRFAKPVAAHEWTTRHQEAFDDMMADAERLAKGYSRRGVTNGSQMGLLLGFWGFRTGVPGGPLVVGVLRASKMFPRLTMAVALVLDKNFPCAAVQLSFGVETVMHTDRRNVGMSCVRSTGPYVCKGLGDLFVAAGGQAKIVAPRGRTARAAGAARAVPASRGLQEMGHRKGSRLPGAAFDTSKGWVFFDARVPHETLPFAGPRRTFIGFQHVVPAAALRNQARAAKAALRKMARLRWRIPFVGAQGGPRTGPRPRTPPAGKARGRLAAMKRARKRLAAMKKTRKPVPPMREAQRKGGKPGLFYATFRAFAGVGRPFLRGFRGCLRLLAWGGMRLSSREIISGGASFG